MELCTGEQAQARGADFTAGRIRAGLSNVGSDGPRYTESGHPSRPEGNERGGCRVVSPGCACGPSAAGRPTIVEGPTTRSGPPYDEAW